MTLARLPRICSRLIFVSGAVLATAALPGQASDWAEPSKDSPCKVWGPSLLVSRSDSGKSEYIARYRGACRNGLAHGAGALEWVNRWSPSHIAGTWQGRFVDGIFVGRQDIGQVSGLPGDRYLIPSAPVSGHDVLIVSQGTQTDPFDLCAIDRVVIEDGNRLDLEDDTAVKDALVRVAKHVRSRCPAVDDFMLELYEGRFQLGPNRNWPANAVVTAAQSREETSGISRYSNRVSSEAGIRQASENRKKMQENARNDFRRFNAQSRVSAWVSPSEVDKNPFQWSGKRIGLFVRLERMISPDRAVVSALKDAAQAFVIVNGVTPETFRSPGVALIADVEPNRARIDGYAFDLAQLRFIESAACGDPDCYLWRQASQQAREDAVFEQSSE